MTIEKKILEILSSINPQADSETVLQAAKDILTILPDVRMVGCNFVGKNEDGTNAITYKEDHGLLVNINQIKMEGWVCIGPAGTSAVSDQVESLLKAVEESTEVIDRIPAFRQE